MSRISSPIAIRTGVTKYWQASNDFKISTTSTYTNYLWLFNAITLLFRKMSLVKLIHIDICKENFFIKIYLIVIVTWAKTFHPMRHFEKRAQIAALTAFTNNYELTKKQTSRQPWSQFLNYLNKVELEKISSVISKNILANYIIPTNKCFLPFKITLNNILYLTRKEIAEVWLYWYTSVKAELWYASRKKFFFATLKVIFFSSVFYSSDMVSTHVASELRKIRRHNELIFFLQELLPLLTWYQKTHKAIKMEIRGCIQDALRTRKAKISDKNKISLSTFMSNPSYALSDSHTAFGSLGIRTWYARQLLINEQLR